jgi:transposase-like protein
MRNEKVRCPKCMNDWMKPIGAPMDGHQLYACPKCHKKALIEPESEESAAVPEPYSEVGW